MASLFSLPHRDYSWWGFFIALRKEPTMIRINNWQDLSLIEDDPELWREAYGFLSVCAYEVREYGDEDDLDINLAILEPDEWDYAEALGPPEETVLTRIECCGQVRVFRRLIYPTEIILLEESSQ